MTDTTLEKTKPSRLQTALERSQRETTAPSVDDYVEDFTTADERLAAFWRKYGKDDVEIKSRSTRVMPAEAITEWTVEVTVEVDSLNGSRVVTASATRSSADENPIVAANPHETAQTAALSRALRFMGIKLSTKKKALTAA